MKMNNRFIYGILSIVLAAIIAFVAIPAVTKKTSSTCEIVRMKTAVSRGTVITSADVELASGDFLYHPDAGDSAFRQAAGRRHYPPVSL